MPTPLELRLHRTSRELEVVFPDKRFSLPVEFLRVHSPSAEVRGHGPGQAKLQWGKREVAIDKIEAQGNYGVRLTFSDGHDTGIYTWDYLFELGINQQAYWQNYLDALHRAGKTRDADASVVKIIE